MAEISLKEAAQSTDHWLRRGLAIFLGFGVFVVATVFISGLFGSANAGDNWLWAGLAGIGGLYAFYSAQKDNRDAASGRISAVVTSTLKDYTVVGLGAFAVAAVLGALGIAPFNVVIAAVIGALLAQFVFNRNWVSLA